MTEFVRIIPSGHAGSGRDGRRGNHSRIANREEVDEFIGRMFVCMHGRDTMDRAHDCLSTENEIRARRGAPAIECPTPHDHIDDTGRHDRWLDEEDGNERST